eukprot:1160120-Pelagomonas_calceolata.AAC.4
MQSLLVAVVDCSSARNMTASIERKLAYDLGYKPPAGSKQTCPNGTAWMERQVQLRHRFTARMPYSAQSRPPFEKCKDIMSPLSLEAYTGVNLPRRREMAWCASDKHSGELNAFIRHAESMCRGRKQASFCA